jgi:hypothetical protein
MSRGRACHQFGRPQELQVQGGNRVNTLPQAQQSGRPAGLAPLLTVKVEESVISLKEPAVCFVVGTFVTLDEWVMMV